MADKNNTSSLLEAIKSKLSKFDNKSKPEKKGSVNYFSQDIQVDKVDNISVDKTNIGLIFEAEKKLENIRKKKLNQNLNSQKDADLDLDDESLNVKEFGQKISIESKLKEIADEINLENFEEDFEDEEDKNDKNIEEKIVAKDTKNIDPIDIELMELEKEISLNNQIKSRNIPDEKVNEDLNLKNYLDSKFEDEFEKIEEEIKNEKKLQDVDLFSNQKKSITGDILKASQEKIINNNSNGIIFDANQNQILFKITPAQDFLNKKVDEIDELETSDQVSQVKKIQKNSQEEVVLEIDKKIPNEINSNNSFNIKKNPENTIDNNIKFDHISQENNIESIDETISEIKPKQNQIDNKIEEKLINNSNKNQDFEDLKNQNITPDRQNIDVSKNYENLSKVGEKNDLFLEKINYNLIHEETIYQAKNSMKKLMEAKNLVNNVGNFARDETLTKIAMNLMEPKLEKWLNDNLPLMVENIIREEIEKIVPKNS